MDIDFDFSENQFYADLIFYELTMNYSVNSISLLY